MLWKSINSSESNNYESSPSRTSDLTTIAELKRKEFCDVDRLDGINVQALYITYDFIGTIGIRTNYLKWLNHHQYDNENHQQRWNFIGNSIKSLWFVILIPSKLLYPS